MSEIKKEEKQKKETEIKISKKQTKERKYNVIQFCDIYKDCQRIGTKEAFKIHLKNNKKYNQSLIMKDWEILFENFLKIKVS